MNKWVCLVGRRRNVLTDTIPMNVMYVKKQPSNQKIPSTSEKNEVPNEAPPAKGEVEDRSLDAKSDRSLHAPYSPADNSCKRFKDTLG